MENLVISYKSKLGLRNNRNGRYLHLNPDTQKFSTSGSHPFIKIKNNGDTVPSNDEYYISCQNNQNYEGPVMFGSGVFLMNKDGMYIVANSQGELRLDSPRFEENTQSFYKTAKWSILDANNISSRRQVYFYDDCVFKSPFGYYLINDQGGKVSGSGNNIVDDSSWKLFKSNIPYIPEWTILRPFISETYLTPEFKHISAEKMIFSSNNLQQLGQNKKQLGEMNALHQEYYLIEDILFCMMSIEGNFIKRVQDNENKSQYIYAIEPNLEHSSCDISLKQLVSKILPICQYHDSLKNFINIHSHFEYGLVSQALCAALKVLIREYILLINQLDNEFLKGELNLQKLWFYVQPSLRVFESLMSVVKECEKLKGGTLLSGLYKLMKNTTDEQTNQVFNFLLDKAFVPYCDMLSKWIYHGVVDDVYEEFLIKERKELSKENINKDYKDNYWMQRFTIREDLIPNFLNKVKDEILFSGKYLNVIRECEKTINCPFAEELSDYYETYIKNMDFSEPILKAYEFANYHLTNLVLKEEELLGRLKSIKHYFFMDQSDYFVNFLDSADDELSKPFKNVSKEKLESLLDMSVRTSSTNNDPFKDDLTCEIYNFTIHEQLFAIQNINAYEANGGSMFTGVSGQKNVFTPLQNIKGIEAFTLDYKVRWPLNIILSKKALTKYQLIFRHLFYCKYIERQLCNTWLIHQSTKELTLQRAITYSYTLTHRMVHFSKNLVYYMVYEVLDQNWTKLENSLKNATNFDQIIKLHDEFLDACLKETLLMDHQLFKVLSKINSSCLIFSKSIQNFTENMKVNEHVNIEGEDTQENLTSLEKRKNRIMQESHATRQIIKEQSYLRTIQKFAKNFDNNLREFMNQANQQYTKYDSHLNNLMSRLDSEGFYGTYFWNNQYQNQQQQQSQNNSMLSGFSGKFN